MLRLRLAGEDVALPAAAVVSVRAGRGMRPERGSEGSPLVGELLLGGQRVPVVDGTALLGGSAAPGARGRRLVLVQAHGTRFGLLVEDTLGLARVPAGALRPVPDYLAAAAGASVAGVIRAERPLLLLSPEALVSQAALAGWAVPADPGGGEGGT